MGNCCGKHAKSNRETRTEEFDKNKQYIDVSLHDEHKIGFDFSISKAREKMGVETICEGKLTHDKELKFSPHSFDLAEQQEENLEHIPKIVDLVANEK